MFLNYFLPINIYFFLLAIEYFLAYVLNMNEYNGKEISILIDKARDRSTSALTITMGRLIIIRDHT